MSRLVAIIGPSGSGKSSVVRELDRRGLVTVHPTWTTRPPRFDELAGALEHRFVSDADFDDLVTQGFFIETVALFGLTHRYGLPALPEFAVDRFDVVMARAPLIERLRELLPVWRVYQIEDDPQIACQRLVARRGGAADVAARVADNRQESDMGRRVADRTFVNDGTIPRLADRVAAALWRDATAAEYVTQRRPS